MSKDYNHEYGYESLLKDFQRYQKETPRGVSMTRKGQTISLQFKVGDKPRSQHGCNCSFTLDGMAEALKKARKVSEALKSFTSEVEFWNWYNQEIKEEGKIQNDLITFGEAIARVENDFWSRSDRRDRARDKNNPSDITSWDDTYGRFYKLLPQDKAVNLSDILTAINAKEKGTKTFKGIVSAMKALVRLNKRRDILEELDVINTKVFKKRTRQRTTLEEFLIWRDKALGITENLHPNADVKTRQRWLWALSTQLAYGLRIHEVFAIQNLDKSFVTQDGVTIPALNDPSNIDNAIVIGHETIIGTTTKTSYRLAVPLCANNEVNLIAKLDIKNPQLPTNRPRSTNPKRLENFWCDTAIQRLKRWNAPITQTHALRRLGNLLGIQVGIPLEVRSQSMGHTSNVNESIYKQDQATQETLNILLRKKQQLFEYAIAVNEAKKLLQDYPDSLEVIAKLIARVYGKDEREIIKLLS